MTQVCSAGMQVVVGCMMAEGWWKLETANLIHTDEIAVQTVSYHFALLRNSNCHENLHPWTGSRMNYFLHGHQPGDV